MKELFYKLFASVYNNSVGHSGRDDKYVALISPHNSFFTDSLGIIGKELNRRGYKLLHIDRSDLFLLTKAPKGYFTKARLLAKCKTIFLNDNFMPLAYMDIPGDVNVIQLWHAMGAFKKFGFDIYQPDEIRQLEKRMSQKLTGIVCSSSHIVPFWASAFGAEESMVKPFGSPSGDMLLSSADNSLKAREKIERMFPECKGKKIILYAPTFRDDAEKDAALLDSFDFDRFEKELGNEYTLLVRLHPQIHSSSADVKRDATQIKNVNELILGCDCLITDYSSLCMDFVLLNKPCYFFAPDLRWYEQTRSFYFDYESGVPGPVSSSTEELISHLKAGKMKDNYTSFRENNLSAVDGNSLERIISYIK